MSIIGTRCKHGFMIGIHSDMLGYHIGTMEENGESHCIMSEFMDDPDIEKLEASMLGREENCKNDSYIEDYKGLIISYGVDHTEFNIYLKEEYEGFADYGPSPEWEGCGSIEEAREWIDSYEPESTYDSYNFDDCN